LPESQSGFHFYASVGNLIRREGSDRHRQKSGEDIFKISLPVSLEAVSRDGAEAVELCEQCDGAGSIPVEDSIVSICDACGAPIGILSSFKRGRGAEMTSTQLHLRATSWGGPAIVPGHTMASGGR
jgi:hypothetical protein